jgi:uncharacterized protein YqfB (UPF0267 family)
MALNRNENEIGVIKLNKEEVFTDNLGSKYLDISTILLKYFELPSLIGIDMQRDIREVTRLKLREIENGLNDEERMELKRLKDIVDSSYVGEVIYNEKYFSFLKFIKDNKGIDFDELDDIDENEFQSFLTKFGDTK